MTAENQNHYGLGVLGSLLYKPEINGIWFNGKEVKLDGYRFVSCRFDNCKITVSSANFEIENCYIDDYSLIIYSGEIVKPIRLYNSRYEWVYEHAPFFAPTKNADGTITIKG
ncbi:hypothetical protein [Methylomonas methanica]|uniref:hypothetical protein n=1 Tax=Methylomonas methanica TaxID=421 RepID=UPI00059E004F|nr:hypothetical protein [Methylomonas methanica]